MFDINREHPEYAARRGTWKRYRDLYVGGEQLKSDASEYLVRRQKEPTDVYAERLSRVFYENYIGSIVDWYAATLFRREPVLEFDGDNQAGKQFFGELTEDCDRKGTSFTDFFRRQFIEMLIGGVSYTLVDFPRTAYAPGNRAEEDALGRSRAYLVGYSAEDVINWSYDEKGNYEWVVIRTSSLKKDKVEDAEWQLETLWSYYDKTQFRVYRRVHRKGEAAAMPQMIDEGTHGLARQKRVPLFPLRVTEGLWLLNRAGLLQLEHFNKSNALGWALTMGLFAMPVVYSERDFTQVLGESYYVQLGPDDKFGWTEPEGKVFQIAVDNLTRLQEEIYRVCYLTQIGGSLTDSRAQSALSKMRDFSVTQEVLRAYGDSVKDAMKRVLRAVETAREDGLAIGVSGMDEFDIGDFSSELQDAQALLGMGIESITLKKQIYRKLALKYLCDARQDVKDRIGQEIDAGFEVKGN